MSSTRSLRGRTGRSLAAVFAVGIALTTAGYVVVHNDGERQARQQTDRAANEALLGVEHVTAAVNQMLATANGVVATSGADATRFVAVLGPDVGASSTIAGMAFVVSEGGRARVAAQVGKSTLLAANVARSLRAQTSATLVARTQDATHYRLAFSERVAHGSGAVYVEVVLAKTASGAAPFAVVSTRDVVLGNVTSVRGLAKWSQPVNVGGQPFALLVRPGQAPTGPSGFPLGALVLLGGALLTVLGGAVALLTARRAYAVEQLSVENRALDEALERQRQIERDLRASQARFEAILRDSPDIIVLLDLERESTEVLNRPDFLGHDCSELAAPGGLAALVSDEDRADADGHFARLRELEAEQVSETTLRLRDVDGNERYARLRFSPLHVEDGPRMLLGSVSDVTDEWANQLREAELQEALRRSQRLDSVGQLAGGIAHDFNNVLAAVVASVELLMDDVPDGRPREYALEIQKAAARGAALVRQLLTFAQRDHVEPEVVDIGEIVTGMEPLLRRSLGAQVQLQMTTPPEPCWVLADPTHIEQVILNLAVNARDAMPAGGILWIAVGIDDDDRVVLSVMDTGTGIDPGVRDHMFDAFVTTKEPGSGTGLGLATVRSIVQEAGGTIGVVSEVDQGTTFELSFPRSVDEAAPREDVVGAEPIDGGRRRVLLVEDDGAVRSALARALERRNFDVVSAPNAAEALRLIAMRSFDLVLTDNVMPGMSGAELVEQLHVSDPEVRVVLMSGFARDAVHADHAPPGLQSLRKPFTTAEMLDAMRRAFDHDPVEEEYA